MTALLYLSWWCLSCLLSLCPRCSLIPGVLCIIPKVLPCLASSGLSSDLFPFGNSRGSTSVTWPTPYWDKQDKWDKHGKHCILYHYCFCLFVFARSFFAFFRCWLGVGLGILCWSMWLRVVFSFVSGLRCGSFGTLIIWLGWVGCTILDYYLWYCNV